MKYNKIIPQLQTKQFLKLKRLWEGCGGEDENDSIISSLEQDLSL